MELNYWMSSRTNPVQKIVEVISTLKATNFVTNQQMMTILKLPFQNQILGEEFSKKTIYIFAILGIFDKFSLQKYLLTFIG